MSQVLPRDPALPQLALALDPQAMAQVFGDALEGALVRTCKIDRIKYRPGRNCSVSYVLGLRDARRGVDFEQHVAARFFSAGAAALRYRQAARRPMLASAAGPALWHLRALDMVAHWLPNDARLDALAVLHDPARLRRECLRPVVAVLTCGHGRLIDHQMSVVQYVPEGRVCARVTLCLQPRPGAPVTTQTLYAKAAAERDGAATHAAMQALYHSPQQASGSLCTPRPVLWQAAVGLHWQLAVPGLDLLDVDPHVGPGVSARVGVHLAALHAAPVPAMRTPTVQELLQQAHQVAELLGRVEPEWKPLLTRLVARLAAGAPAMAREPAVTLHGDLHPRNILVDGPSLALIDLDSVGRGPAVIELGAWVADALYRSVQGEVAPHQAASSSRAFLSAYATAAGRSADESLLAWSTAHHLLCQRAYRGVANLKPGRFEAVPRLLALADSIAGAATIDAAMSREAQPA